MALTGRCGGGPSEIASASGRAISSSILTSRAADQGLEHRGWATIISPRAAISAQVLVTDRMRPLRVGGRTVHQIGLPYHWGRGSDAVVSGDSANDLVGVTLDPNVLIQESKTGSCDIRPGPAPEGQERIRLVQAYQERAGLTVQTGNQAVTDPALERALRGENRGG